MYTLYKLLKIFIPKYIYIYTHTHIYIYIYTVNCYTESLVIALFIVKR